MDNQYDPLLELLQICNGSIYLCVNDHRSSYQSVAEYAKSFNRYVVIPEQMLAKMIEADRFVTLVFVPVREDRETVRMYGACIHEVLTRACYRIRQQKHLLALPHPQGRVNSTTLLKQLVETCKGEVILTLNEFKGRWHSTPKDGHIWDATAKDFFADMEMNDPDKLQADKDGDYEISPAERQAMEELNQTLHIQFYPNTPVGFYDWFDTDLSDMLERANEIADRAVGSMERTVEIMAESKFT